MAGNHRSVARQLPSEKVVEAVATQTGADPLELPPLYGTLDPDALDAAVQGLQEGEVCFRYAGTSVTVHSDGTVDVAETHRACCAGRESECAD